MASGIGFRLIVVSDLKPGATGFLFVVVGVGFKICFDEVEFVARWEADPFVLAPGWKSRRMAMDGNGTIFMTPSARLT